MCGIWGIVNTKPRRFDFTTFCTLGIANDSRGGDSCGYFIDGHYEYGSKGDKKWFQCFFPENEFLKTCFESTIAFGHCRKASIGKIDETTAQPVVITNKQGKIEYVLMHNGTIHNYEELAKKYIPEINIKGMTDSQVMARIFYYTGYDSLNEYNGGAVFAIADYRKKTPEILLFKGASKKDKYSKDKTEERPLYFCIDVDKEELVFSSICSYLMALRPGLITWDINSNILLKFDGKDIVPIKEFPRDDVYQHKERPIASYSKYFYDDFNYNNFVYDDYILLNQLNNTYSGKGSLLSGKYIITEFGRIVDKPCKTSDCKEIYFWNGIALRNSSCFKFLYALKKQTGLTNDIFNSKFKLLIRYLSCDQVFSEGEQWFKALSPTEKEPFTGTLKMLTATTSIEFINGFKTITKYGRSCRQAFEILNDTLDETFKEIKEKCKSLMK